MRRNLHYTSSDASVGRYPPKCSTSRASSIKSSRRNRARPSPMTTSGSGATRSVHCRGMERTWPSTSSSNRVPERLYRSPMRTNCRPLNGWNGCVTRTRLVLGATPPAFWLELQAAFARSLSLVAEEGWSKVLSAGGSRVAVAAVERECVGGRGDAGLAAASGDVSAVRSFRERAVRNGLAF